jgi:asparagine synthase (glutamine-hydrolysing)
MSAQFGRWNLDGKPVDCAYLEKVKETLAPYGPDCCTSFASGNIAILYHAFHATKESRKEVQPHIAKSGAVITWDGRLDNRADLIRELRDPLTVNSTDMAIVATAYAKWGTKSLGKLLGDWAISILNPIEDSLLLAKDPIGTRHLYYSFDRHEITWSTVLDPVVRLAGKTFELDEEYIAGWLSMFPATHLTPCQGVHSVPPSFYVLLRPGRQAVNKYWDFDPEKQIRYRSDAEYEEHFRSVFATAVRRRLRSNRPVLAELSGGRDSSSVVCVADEIIAHGEAECPRLDTISYYDDSEPNWNERPYFTKVEEKRGRCGCHIDIGLQEPEEGLCQLSTGSRPARFAATPGPDGRPLRKVGACLRSNGNRVVLSGIGGDETTGGVPTPVPELAGLMVRGRFRGLAHQLKLWSLEKRKPWFHLFWDAVRRFFPSSIAGLPRYMQPPPWLQTSFVKLHRSALTGYPVRMNPFGPPPNFQENMLALDALRRQLGCATLPFEPTFEKRYPYLDLDLLEFLFAIPREQLVRPTQRRSLMRRALAGIVPGEILNRRSKAFVVRSPMVAISNDWTHIAKLTQNMLGSSLGIADSKRLLDVLQKVRRGEEVLVVALSRTLLLENWLRDLGTLGVINVNAGLRCSPRSQAPIQHEVS